MNVRDRRAQLQHNPGVGLYLNFNTVDRIDRYLAELGFPKRQEPHIAFFDMLWAQMLYITWAVREELVYAALPRTIVRQRAGEVAGSEKFVDFCRELAVEMLREVAHEGRWTEDQ